MTSVFACRVSHKIVTSARFSHFLALFCQKKSLESIWYVCMSTIKYFIIGINKTVVFLFHSILLTLQMFASFSHFNSSPSVTSLVWTLSPYFFSPYHDCQFSKCLLCQKVKVLESFVNSYIFCIRKKEIWQEILLPLC